MGFKKLKFGTEEIAQIIIFDVDGRELDKFNVHKSDLWKVVKILESKYGLGFKVIPRKRKEDVDRDVDWALR